MIVKKFQAETETEAILKAKDELGSGAVVLNVKTLKQRGVVTESRELTIDTDAGIFSALLHLRKKNLLMALIIKGQPWKIKVLIVDL